MRYCSGLCASALQTHMCHTAVLKGFLVVLQAGGVSKQQQRYRQHSARQLMTALRDWAHTCIQEDWGSSTTASSMSGGRRTVIKRTPELAAHAAAGNDLRGSLLLYARLNVQKPAPTQHV